MQVVSKQLIKSPDIMIIWFNLEWVNNYISGYVMHNLVGIAFYKPF